MRGQDTQQAGLFSYLSPEERVPATHPLQPIRQDMDTALTAWSSQLDQLDARTGRPSIAPEKLLRALLLQVLYSLRSERLLMAELRYNRLFRWFVGLDLDAPVWDVTVFTTNRDRLLKGRSRLVLRARAGASHGSPALVRRAFHGRWHADQSLGGPAAGFCCACVGTEHSEVSTAHLIVGLVHRGSRTARMEHNSYPQRAPTPRHGRKRSPTRVRRPCSGAAHFRVPAR